MRDERVDDARVVHPAAALAKDRRAPSSSVMRRRYGRSEVSASKQSTTDRMRAPIGMSVAAHAARIAGAVPVLVMAAHDRHDRIREVDERQDVGADVDVALHLLELGRRQLAGLVEDVLGHRELAGVVQQRRRLDRLQRRLVGDAERARQADARTPARGARGCASRRPWRRSPSPASRPSTGTGDRRRARCRLRVLEPAERRPQRQVKHREQRQHHESRRSGSPAGSAGSGRTRPTPPPSSSTPEPQEMLAPDLDRRLPRVEADGDRGEAGVQHEVDERQREQRHDQPPTGACRAAPAAATPASQKNACAPAQIEARARRC